MKEIFKRFRELIEFYKNDSYHKNYFLDLYAETVWYYGDTQDFEDYYAFLDKEFPQPAIHEYSKTLDKILSKMVKELAALKEMKDYENN